MLLRRKKCLNSIHRGGGTKLNAVRGSLGVVPVERLRQRVMWCKDTCAYDEFGASQARLFER